MFLIDSNFCKKLSQSDEKLKDRQITPKMMRSFTIPKKEQIIQCLSGLNTIGGVSTTTCDLEEISTNEGSYLK